MSEYKSKAGYFKIPERSTRIIVLALGIFSTIYLIVFIISLFITPLGMNTNEVFNNMSPIQTKQVPTDNSH